MVTQIIGYQFRFHFDVTQKNAEDASYFEKHKNIKLLLNDCEMI